MALIIDQHNNKSDQCVYVCSCHGKNSADQPFAHRQVIVAFCNSPTQENL